MSVMKDIFLQELKLVYRPGINALADYLETTDFFTAPASTNHHGAHAGGLCEHSLMVLKHLRIINSGHGVLLDPDSVVLAALLHDVCKVNYYKETTRNVKNEQTGKWEQIPYYTISDAFPLGNGEKSAFVVGRYIELQEDELLAIRWHMGGFDESARGGYAATQCMSVAMKKHPLAVALHLADMAASYFEGK